MGGGDGGCGGGDSCGGGGDGSDALEPNTLRPKGLLWHRGVFRDAWLFRECARGRKEAETPNLAPGDATDTVMGTVQGTS